MTADDDERADEAAAAGAAAARRADAARQTRRRYGGMTALEREGGEVRRNAFAQEVLDTLASSGGRYLAPPR